MSRRAGPGSDRAAQNAQTLKTLVKLEGNKVCADCKRNKHPRWASWNLGVFVCIRCSGIHRGMGTHISRVKSVDLDAWTDEQLQSILKWGNTRANKYWEAKLAPGHVPSEAKIENFIRTKYESKRWTMDGPIPDPSTLGSDDDVPLNIVQEKAKIERSSSQRVASSQPVAVQPRTASQTVNLFDDFAPEPPVRPSTADIVAPRPSGPVTAPAPRHKPQESLLGLDFFGGGQPTAAGVGRPSSAASGPASATATRGDLKNSILSLYASAPKQQPKSAVEPTCDRQASFGAAPLGSAKTDAFGGLADAFGGLTFTNTTSPPQPTQFPSSGSLTGLSFPSTVPAKASPAAPQVSSPATGPPPPLSGGSFFDAAPAKPAPKPPAPASQLDFSFTQNATPAVPPKPAAPVVPADPFDDDGFGSFASGPSPVATAPPRQPKPMSPPIKAASDFGSAFNLSAKAPPAPQMSPQTTRPTFQTQNTNAMFDPWGAASDNAWGAPEPASAKPVAPKVELGSVPAHITPNDISGGWGAPLSSSKAPVQPKVMADEDFGGWTSASMPNAAPASAPAPAPARQTGGFGASDPFDNPWG